MERKRACLVSVAAVGSLVKVAVGVAGAILTSPMHERLDHAEGQVEREE